MADRRDEDVRQRTKIMPNSPLIARGGALSQNYSPPLFETPHRDTIEMFPGGVTELHLDNAEIHLRPDDYNPETRKRKGDLVEGPNELRRSDMGM